MVLDSGACAKIGTKKLIPTEDNFVGVQELAAVALARETLPEFLADECGPHGLTIRDHRISPKRKQQSS